MVCGSLRSCLLYLRRRVSQRPGSRPSLNTVDTNTLRPDKGLSGGGTYDIHAQESSTIGGVWLDHLSPCSNSFPLKMCFVKDFPSLGGRRAYTGIFFFVDTDYLF